MYTVGQRVKALTVKTGVNKSLRQGAIGTIKSVQNVSWTSRVQYIVDFDEHGTWGMYSDQIWLVEEEPLDAAPASEPDGGAGVSDLERAMITVRRATESGEYQKLIEDPAFQARVKALIEKEGWRMSIFEEHAYEMYGDGYAAAFGEINTLQKRVDELEAQLAAANARAGKLEAALRKVATLNPDNYGPIDALTKVYELKREAADALGGEGAG